MFVTILKVCCCLAAVSSNVAFPVKPKSQPDEKKSPKSVLPFFNAKLPFADLLNLPTFGFGGDKPVPLLKLPFSNFGLPAGLKGLLDRPLISVRRRRERKKSERNGPKLERDGGGAPPVEDKEAPFVINLPLANFMLPLSEVTEKRQALPQGAEARLRQVERQENELQQKSDERGGEVRQQSSGSPSLPFFIDTTGNILSEGLRKGNLETVLKTRGPKRGNADLPVDNQLSLPLSVVESPFSVVQLPLNKILLPLSRLNSPGDVGPPVSLAENSGKDSEEEAAKAKGSLKEAGEARAISDCRPNDLVCQASEALKPPSNLNSLSLPYSFLNTPLGFFNLPLSYLNLPYGSFNHPLGHLNLPFGFFNLPLFELLQTFEGAPLAGRSAESNPNQSSPDAEQGEHKQAPPPNDVVSLEDILSGAGNSEESEKQLDELVKFFDEYTAAANENSKVSPSAATILNADEALAVADKFIAAAFSADDKTSAQTLAGFEQTFRDTVASVPELGGLLGTPFGTFPTPFSLFNLPLGFLDNPLGFLNLPLSHFNLPLAHLTLPFSGFSLPLQDIQLPELDQDVHSATVELSDVPPSLLEASNPENTLNSYLNLPLAELNLPFAVTDLPFAVFDLPLAFFNLPLGHFNTPLTHLHLPFEISNLPLAELGLPFSSLLRSADAPQQQN